MKRLHQAHLLFTFLVFFALASTQEKSCTWFFYIDNFPGTFDNDLDNSFKSQIISESLKPISIILPIIWKMLIYRLLIIYLLLRHYIYTKFCQKVQICIKMLQNCTKIHSQSVIIRFQNFSGLKLFQYWIRY